MKNWFCLLAVVCGFFVHHAALAAADDEAYFKQFLYRVEDLNNDPEFPAKYRYYMMMAEYLFKVPMVNGDELIIMYDVKLNPDGTFESLYRDMIRAAGSGPDDYDRPRFCLEHKGTWSVPDKELEMRDENGRLVYIGARGLVNGKNSVLFTLTDDFAVQELRGVSYDFVMAQGDTEPKLKCWPFPR